MKKELLIVVSFLMATGCTNINRNRSGNDFEICETPNVHFVQNFDGDTVSYNQTMSLMVPSGTDLFQQNVNRDLSDLLFNSSLPAKEAWKTYSDSIKDDYLRDVSAEAYRSKRTKEPSFIAPLWNFDYDLNTSVKFSNNGIFNYYIEIYTFTGGAHGSTFRTCRNYDAKDGHLVLLSDIVKTENNNMLADIIYKKFLYQVGAADSTDLDNLGYFVSSSIPVSENYIIKDDTLSFIYNQYEIAPYSTGISIIDVPMSDIPASMKMRRLRKK